MTLLKGPPYCILLLHVLRHDWRVQSAAIRCTHSGCSFTQAAAVAIPVLCGYATERLTSGRCADLNRAAF